MRGRSVGLYVTDFLLKGRSLIDTVVLYLVLL